MRLIVKKHYQCGYTEHDNKGDMRDFMIHGFSGKNKNERPRRTTLNKASQTLYLSFYYDYPFKGSKNKPTPKHSMRELDRRLDAILKDDELLPKSKTKSKSSYRSRRKSRRSNRTQ